MINRKKYIKYSLFVIFLMFLEYQVFFSLELYRVSVRAVIIRYRLEIQEPKSEYSYELIFLSVVYAFSFENISVTIVESKLTFLDLLSCRCCHCLNSSAHHRLMRPTHLIDVCYLLGLSWLNHTLRTNIS